MRCRLCTEVCVCVCVLMRCRLHRYLGVWGGGRVNEM